MAGFALSTEVFVDNAKTYKRVEVGHSSYRLRRVRQRMITSTIQSILKVIVEPINESLSLLRKVDAKLDAQATSKFQGAISSIELVHSLPKPDTNILSIALSSLNESAIYFRQMAQQTESQMDRQVNGYRAAAKFITKSLRDLIGFGGGALKEVIGLQLAALNYSTLSILASIGKLLCMAELKYPDKLLRMEYNELRAMQIDIDLEREVVFPLAAKRGLIPKEINLLDQHAFEKEYGAALSLDDFAQIPVSDEDDLIERVFTKLVEQGGILYWLDDDMVRRWVGACLRYAALKTRIMRTGSPRGFLESLAKGWQSTTPKADSQ